jgi:hypothetical protein
VTSRSGRGRWERVLAARRARTSRLAIASFITGALGTGILIALLMGAGIPDVISWADMSKFMIVISLAAAITGGISLLRIRFSGNVLRGVGLASAGLIMGTVGLIAIVAWLYVRALAFIPFF